MSGGEACVGTGQGERAPWVMGSEHRSPRETESAARVTDLGQSCQVGEGEREGKGKGRNGGKKQLDEARKNEQTQKFLPRPPVASRPLRSTGRKAGVPSITR